MPYDDKSDLDPKAKALKAKDENPLMAPAVEEPALPELPAEPELPQESIEDLMPELRALLERLEAAAGTGEV